MNSQQNDTHQIFPEPSKKLSFPPANKQKHNNNIVNATQQKAFNTKEPNCTQVTTERC
jgi:hypothetical protein